MQTNTLAILQQRFTRSAITVFAVYGLGLLLLFLSQVVLARVLGIEEYGVYTYILSWLGILVLVGKLGVDYSLQRFIPQYTARGEWGYCRGVLVRSYQVGIIASVVLALVLLTAGRYILSGLDNMPGAMVQVMVAIVPFWVLLKVGSGAFLAFGRPVFAHLTENIVPPAVMIAGALLAAAVAFVPVNALTMLVLFLLAVGSALVASLWLLLLRTLPAQLAGSVTQYDTKRWLGVAFPLFVMSGMYVIMSYTDVVMVGALSSTTDAGIYAAASRIAAFVVMPLTLMNTVLSPYISGLYHAGRHGELQRVVSVASAISGTLALPACIVLGLFGGFFLGFFGTGFGAGRDAMNLLLVGQLVNVLSGSVGMLLSMTGRHYFASLIVTACALLNVLLNYLLIPRFGMTGAALATAVTMILWNVAFVFRVRSVLDIRPTFLCALVMRR